MKRKRPTPNRSFSIETNSAANLEQHHNADYVIEPPPPSHFTASSKSTRTTSPRITSVSPFLTALRAFHDEGAPSAKTLQGWLLRTHGTLTELLTCSLKVLEGDIATLDSTTLSQLLSVLKDSIQDDDNNNDGIDDDTIREEGYSRRHVGSRNVHSVLNFVHRLIGSRYYLNYEDKHYGSEDAIEFWNEPILASLKESKDDNEGWVICVAFMIAYDALYARLKSRHFPTRNAMVEIGKDKIVASALCIIRAIKCIGNAPTRRMYQVQENYDGTLILQKCFAKQLQKLNSLVQSILKARFWNHHNLDVSSNSHVTNAETDFELLFKKIDSDPTDNENNSQMDCEVEHKSTPKTTDLRQSDSSFVEEHLLDSALIEPRTKQQKKDESSQMSPLESAALTLRHDLLELPPGATASEVLNMSNQISDLIQKAGSKLGADGITLVGRILAFGSSLKDINADEEDSNIKYALDDGERDDKEYSSPFTDALIANLLNSCITDQTSTVRSCAFIETFVLPLTKALGKVDSRPASRILMSVISTLTRDRIMECIDYLLVPTLCQSGTSIRNNAQDQNEKEPDSSNGQCNPSQTQCELVGRIVKSAEMTREGASRLLERLVVKSSTNGHNGSRLNYMPMTWTIHSIPVITACLQKKCSLSNNTITAIAYQIDRTSKDDTMAKDMKFSTLFHSLVTKFGPQLKGTDCVYILRIAAGRLKTFMTKTVSAALKKL